MNSRCRDLDKLSHDINSKCASLTNAVTLLRNLSPRDAGDLLTLMAAHVDSLKRSICEYHVNGEVSNGKESQARHVQEL